MNCRQPLHYGCRLLLLLCLVAGCTAKIDSFEMEMERRQRQVPLDDANRLVESAAFTPEEATRSSESGEKDVSVTTTSTSAKPRRIMLPVNTHPYMKIIYDEIERDAHDKWTAMDVAGATVQGIEPIMVSDDRLTGATILQFNVASLIGKSRDIRQLDLVLIRAGSPEDHVRRHGRGDGEDLYVVEMLDATSSSSRSGSVVRPLYRRSNDGQRHHYAVLELRTFVETWFAAHLRGHALLQNIVHLRVAPTTSTAPAAVAEPELADPATEMLRQRPLLLVYYVAGTEELGRVRRALRGAAGRGRRSFPSAHQQPKPYAKGSRKVPRPDNKSLPITPPPPPHTHRDEACVLHQYYVSLEDLQWASWIVAPPQLSLNYCAGNCKAPIVESYYNATYNSIVRSTLVEINPIEAFAEVPGPCCVPTELLSANILYYAGDRPTIKRLESMTAIRCGCK